MEKSDSSNSSNNNNSAIPARPSSQRFDMNLLRILDTLMECRSVSAAARQLHLSQSTVSHALARAREQLNDPLFVAGSEGMMPTPRALALTPAFSQALATVEQALQETPLFDPASSLRTFRLATGVYFDMVMLPHLMQEITRDAPGIRLSIKSLTSSGYEEEMEKGEYDLVIGFAEPDQLSARLQTQDLVSDAFSLLSRDPLPEHIDAQFLAAQSYVYPSEWGHSQLLTDRWLNSIGIERHIPLQLPDFQSVPIVLQATDLVCVLPTWIAERYARDHGLYAQPVNSDLRLKLVLGWHPRFAMDAGLIWLKERILHIRDTLL